MITGTELQSLNSINAEFQAAAAAKLPEAPILHLSDLQMPPAQKPEQKAQAQAQIQAQTQAPNEPTDIAEKYNRLSVRYKHLVDERDALSRQVWEFRRKLEENPSGKRDVNEEIRLLNRLIDEEQALRAEAHEKGVLPAGYDALSRHDRFVNAFLSIIAREQK